MHRLTRVGEVANTTTGSQSTKHSHIDQSLGKKDANNTTGLGVRGGREASIYCWK
jgi:plastocyanin domain-containing protein